MIQKKYAGAYPARRYPSYGIPQPSQDLGEAPRKILIPEKYETAAAVVIGRHHLDTNHHVNNSQYVEIAKDAIPVGLKIREIRADYKKAARLGRYGDSQNHAGRPGPVDCGPCK